MSTLNANRNKFLKLDGATASASLKTYSPKLDLILRKIAESPGPNLVYSQFKTVEGLGVLGIALKANGYEEIRVSTNRRDELFLPPETVESIKKGPGVRRFITFSGDGTREEKMCTLQIFNGQLNKLPPDVKKVFQNSKDADGKPLYDVTGETTKYLHGEICKVIGITGAGAEGISLRNVRQVHIMEPYWNMVRIEQVKGRAVRICSHMDLPMDERNVEIYSYVMRFSNEQRREVGAAGIPSLIATTDVEIRNEGGRKVPYVYTSDESVYLVAQRKEQITQSLLRMMKEVAVDCRLNAPDNEPDDLKCFVINAPDPASQDRKMFDPDLMKDLEETGGRAAMRVDAAKAARGAAAGGAGAGAAPATAAVREVVKTVQYLELMDSKTKEVVRFVIGKPDKDGFVFLCEEKDIQCKRPVMKAQVIMGADGPTYRPMRL